jgi:cell fate (sporulation/competence/biofilm development) regulator YlbF (YheA/YmcA/DUF963 family)
LNGSKDVSSSKAPTKKIKKTASKKTASKAAVKAKSKAQAAKESAPKKAVSTDSLDRKGLALRARELKRELMGIRFNQQNPSISDYRKKRRELAKVLGQLA